MLRTLEEDSFGIVSIAFTPDSATLASGAVDKKVRLWRVSDGTHLRTLEGHTGNIFAYGYAGAVNEMAFSPDGSLLISGGSDMTVRFWRVSDGLLLKTIKPGGDNIWGMALSPDGTILAVADRSVRLFDMRQFGLENYEPD